MPGTTKNLGMVKAIHIGLTPPLNTVMLWYDDNVSQKVLKRYDTMSSSWIILSASGVDKNQVISFTAQTNLSITHTLNKLASVTIIDASGLQIVGQVQYNLSNLNLINITFSTAQTGFVILN